MLQVRNVTKVYIAKKSIPTIALKNVSISFPERGMVFILGKSGSGKSTLLNIIGGLDKPDTGEIIIDGKSSYNFKDKDLDGYRNSYVGFVFQEYNLIENYTVGVNISLAAELHGKKVKREEIEELLRQVELTDDEGRTFYDRKINELSGGQKQRVAIVRALVKDPKIILADEPTGALDYESGINLYEILKKLAEDRLVIIVSHDRENAERYADRIIELKDGYVIRDDEICIRQNENDVTTPIKIKGGGNLHIRTVAKMSVNALRAKPLRLIISIIISVMALMMFGISFTALTADKYECELRTMAEKGYNVIIVNKRDCFTDYDLDAVREYTGHEPYRVYRTDGSSLHHYIGIEYEDILLKRNPYESFACSFGNAVAVDPARGEKDLFLTPDERFYDKDLCRLPETSDEIAITDIHADMFIRYGYKNTDGGIIDIKTPDDLIGLTLGEYSIVGVYSTEQDADYFRKYDIDNFGLTAEQIADYNRTGRTDTADMSKYDCEWSRISSSSRNTAVSCVFLAGDERLVASYDDGIRNIMFPLTDDLATNTELIKKLASGSGEYDFSLYSPVSGLVLAADFFFRFFIVELIIGAVFVVIAILFMMNYYSVSIDYRRRELGILRALGAGKKTLVFVCLAESLFLTLIEFALSIACVIITCVIINSYFMVSLYAFGILPFAIMLAVGFGASALSTIIPVIRLAKKKPADMLKN